MYALYRKSMKHKEVEGIGSPLHPIIKMQASASILLGSFPLRFLCIDYLFSHYCNYTMGIIV